MEHGRRKIIDTILFSLILGFCSGIVFDSLSIHAAAAPILLGIGAAAFVLLLAFLLIKKPQVLLLAASMFLIAGLLGAYRMEIAKPDMAYLADKVGQKVTLKGVIDGPEFHSGGIQFTLDTGNAGIKVSTKDYQPLAYGDEVEVTGKLYQPENFTTDQGTEFDYVSYLYKDDVLYQMSYAKVTVLSHGHGNWLVAKLGPVEDWFLASFDRVLPVQDADLEGGLVLGSKENISS